MFRIVQKQLIVTANILALSTNDIVSCISINSVIFTCGGEREEANNDGVTAEVASVGGEWRLQIYDSDIFVGMDGEVLNIHLVNNFFAAAAGALLSIVFGVGGIFMCVACQDKLGWQYELQ